MSDTEVVVIVRAGFQSEGKANNKVKDVLKGSDYEVLGEGTAGKAVSVSADQVPAILEGIATVLRGGLSGQDGEDGRVYDKIDNLVVCIQSKTHPKGKTDDG